MMIITIIIATMTRTRPRPRDHFVWKTKQHVRSTLSPVVLFSSDLRVWVSLDSAQDQVPKS